MPAAVSSPLQESPRSYRHIADRLLQQVRAGDFGTSQRLPAERELARLMGVSRPSMREALIALEVQGLIDVRVGSGIYIRDGALATTATGIASNAQMDRWGPLELMAAREVVECEVAALAAQHASAADVARMRRSITQMRRARNEIMASREADQDFHEAMSRACANQVLYDTVHAYWLARQGPLFQQLGKHFETPASWQGAIVEHEAVVSAIAAHNPTAARVAIRRHLRNAFKRYNASWNAANRTDPLQQKGNVK